VECCWPWFLPQSLPMGNSGLAVSYIGLARCDFQLAAFQGRNDVYFDGRLVRSYTTSDSAAPHFLIINVGYWSGSQVFGPAGAVRVDYVRVWK